MAKLQRPEYLLLELGFDLDEFGYGMWCGRYVRYIPVIGLFEVSEPFDTFDRWANSTELSFDIWLKKGQRRLRKWLKSYQLREEQV